MRGYTLVEILGVVSLILLLSGITFGTASGIQAAKMKSIAKAEIGLISHALSSFCNTYGDYPVTKGTEKNSITLSKSLLGWKVFDGKRGKMVDLKEAPNNGLISFIDINKVLYRGKMPMTNKIMPDNIEFIDPWGEPYVYAYKESESWDNFSYVLYSKGPDKTHSKLGQYGLLSSESKNLEKNADNIYLED